MNETNPAVPPPPWWKFGHVWLVLAGPIIVVIAGFITLYLAVSMPDPVISQDYYRKGIEINKTLEADPASLAPAVQARNHAATGAPPPARPADKP
ncbi:FixH family protein [Curvibacter sp. PAE-UM]|uniref:FixH family protein n=1 Tax=Curvibacter sp. PAE-UM TaxID=1714344 RepID=UPI00070C789D|nr:FixH family protein [Curvibacter sp. PAE-UM]KRI00792.1 nitrogen fixation protein FixH [Curvibacter sp. PAE-UM]